MTTRHVYEQIDPASIIYSASCAYAKAAYKFDPVSMEIRVISDPVSYPLRAVVEIDGLSMVPVVSLGSALNVAIPPELFVFECTDPRYTKQLKHKKL